MDTNTASFEALKQILRHIQNPELLDDHPWTHSLIVREATTNILDMTQVSRGQQLLGAIAELFRELQPAHPPRNGKRLDPRWGEFGLLAALYFVPFNHGTPIPTSLMDAWGRIDLAILYMVYRKPAEELSEAEIRKYQLVGDELAYGSVSTLSDWHKKGLQRLNEAILNRERFLARTLQKTSSILQSDEVDITAKSEPPVSPKATERKKISVRTRRTIWLSLCLLLVLVLGLGAFKSWRVYERGMLVYQDVTRLQGLANEPIGTDTLDDVVPLLANTQSDLAEFKREAGPFLWMAPLFDWLPYYGYDVASAPALIELADHLLNASILSSQSAQPLLNELNADNSTLDPAGLTVLLVEAQPQLNDAREELDEALVIREKIKAGQLSPRVSSLMVEKIDPALGLFDESLSIATILPDLLGAGNEGPKTYLLLVQNEDELRPTGGFITSIGNLVIHNGQVISLDFEEAGELEDWSKPYPAAPWQLQQYMNSPVLVLRDSNWFTDFPTAALWAEYLYAYTHSHSVDGVIAFDQHFLVMLLGVIGPLEVDGAPYPITDQNVIEYMRQAKSPPVGEPVPVGWYRKEFIGDIANAVLNEIMGGKSRNWRGLAEIFPRALEERHLLLQFDNSAVEELLTEHNWDNTLRAENGDYLMVTDTNIGFNKTNAVVDVGLSYDVDLTDIEFPVAALTVTHKNNASKDIPCIHWNTGEITEERPYPIDRCYWNYLRVYKQAGVELLDATPHAVPGEWMLLGQNVPARVDVLEDEAAGVQGFGTLMVVPGGQTLNTSFEFALPASVVLRDDDTGLFMYHLKVHKQPGRLADPLAIRVHLPSRSSVHSVNMNGLVQDNNLLINTDLLTDVDLELVFALE